MWGKARKRRDEIVIYTIRGSTIRNFLIIDMFTGTGVYYLLKLVSSSMLIGMIGSTIGTEGIKRLQRLRVKGVWKGRKGST